ncbi:hypothetical protein CVT26_015967 [Gymnopilus dilepis]|uniref:AB hydrolase-1 domain-containing protein n=1 Tax=Gymnopilus dilepis TaxID=231916 RepID=A0A409XYI5_9AGAR|nr:hypothetical protein CVT26_015967 [Gymnopilus dilepis]
MQARRRLAFLYLIVSSCVLAGVLFRFLVNLDSLSLILARNHLVTSSSVEFSWDTLLPSQTLAWTKCYPGRECARLIVPLNYSDPDGPEAAIALIRRPSYLPEGSKDYRGPVLFNPGGPGGSGVDMVWKAADLLSTIIGPQFDIVGFDPRGVSRSTPQSIFFKTEVEQELWGWKSDLIVNNSDSGVARTWARAQVIGKLAAESDGGYLRHINTENTARDMLHIVKAHGQSKLQYWGMSYGTVLGATFAALFPDNVGRLVIDGVVDSEDYYATLWSKNLLDTDKTLETFLTGCVEAGPEDCAFWAPTPKDINNNLTTLYDSLRSRPLPIKTDQTYGVLEYGHLKAFVLAALYSPYALYPALAQALARLAAGDGSLLFSFLFPPPYQCACGPSEAPYDNLREAQISILCNDGDDVPDDLESSQKYFEELYESSDWAEMWARIRLDCVGWPKFPKDHFQGPFVANTSYPILLVGNTADPVTPLWAAKKMSKGFNNSVVLTQDSPGHCSVAAPSVCTMNHIRNYFIHGTLPEPSTVCEPIGKPFPESIQVASPFGQSAAGEHATQDPLMASMSQEDRVLYDAVRELGKKNIISNPFLGFGPLF